MGTEVVRWDQIEGWRVLRAGAGEWYNQPHERRWDMGEDVQELPPTDWQQAISQLQEESGDHTPNLIVDFSEFDWLAGQDWGFLVRVANALASHGACLTVVVSERVAKASSPFAIEGVLSIVRTMDEALA